MSRIHKPKTKLQLQKFALTLAICFGIVSFLIGRKSPTIGVTELITNLLALLLLIAGLLFPLKLQKVEQLWTIFGEKIGAVMSLVILCILYYLLIVPMACGMRLFGKKLLALSFDSTEKSYWIQKDNTDERHYLPY